MKYRRFGKLDWEASVLGFGAMRLPVIDGDQNRIDEPEAIRMIRHAIDQGVNYVDTAYPYHGGHSEALVGRALGDGYRDKVRLATKLPPWFVSRREDFDRILGEQLERLATDHIDFYLLHGLNQEFWPKLRDLGVIQWAEGELGRGRIRHLGFSFHDELEAFEKIVDAYYSWTFCQIQYNFMDVEHQAGRAGLEYAAERGLGVVVMEPIRGGQVVKKIPESIARLWARAGQGRTIADRALQFVWDHPGVSVALSGMSDMTQLEENLGSADRARAGSLGPEEHELLKDIREKYAGLCPIACTSCGYCLPCENGVRISRIFELYNDGFIYQDHRRSRFLYRMLPPDQQADNCQECGNCEEHCPQHIEVRQWLKKVHDWLGPKKS
jgi:predicted aldo/keto reductase-like oxidoreductase